MIRLCQIINFHDEKCQVPEHNENINKHGKRAFFSIKVVTFLEWTAICFKDE